MVKVSQGALLKCTVMLATVVWVVPLVAGHAFLAEPPSRNVVANQEGREWCPHCLQGGGPGTVSGRGGGHWPTVERPASHGLCGDPVQNVAVEANWRDETYLVPSPVQRSYTAGEVVEFRIGISTHHRGHYEFRICDRALDGQTMTSREDAQGCLNTWVLERAPPRSDCQPDDADPDCQPLDLDHPGRWYLPPAGKGTQKAGLDWEDADAVPAMTEVHSMRYKIPAGLSCTHCTLQWYWSTGNTCLYDDGYFKYFARMQSLGWSSTSWCNFCTSGATCQSTCCGPTSGKYAEEFWNCADIAVMPGGNSPTPSDPTPEPEPEPETEPATTKAPTPAPGPCSTLWGQCGGGSWGGYSCCESGSYCKKVDPQWYHQCVPGSDPTATTPAATTLAPSPAPQSSTTSSPSGVPAPGGECACSKSTIWDGSFTQFSTTTSFCDQNFGGNNPYISAGGGAGSSGGWSGTEPCTSGQFQFSSESGWQISVGKSQAEGKVPYRAFSYLQFCNGQAYRNCWTEQRMSFSFSFMTEGIKEIGAYVKLLFWTDAGNILGLLPPNHPKGSGSFRLLAFPVDDYPNSWKYEASLSDASWNHVRVDFEPTTRTVDIYLNGASLGSSTIPVNMLDSTNGPQIGVYSFDFGPAAWPGDYSLWLNDMCVGQSSGTCPSATPAMATSAVPTLVPAPTESPEPPTTTSSPEPMELSCADFCSKQDISASGGCGSMSNDQTSCLSSYIWKANVAIPCSWDSCGCHANGEDLLACPDLTMQCSALVQRTVLRGGHAHRRPIHRGLAFVEASSELSRGQWYEEVALVPTEREQTTRSEL